MTRFIITQELSPKDYLYLRCLTNDYKHSDIPLYQRLYQRLSDDYQKHRKSSIYSKYIYELAYANTKQKGDRFMSKEATQKMDLYTMFELTHNEIREQQRKKMKSIIPQSFRKKMQRSPN